MGLLFFIQRSQKTRHALRYSYLQLENKKAFEKIKKSEKMTKISELSLQYWQFRLPFYWFHGSTKLRGEKNTLASFKKLEFVSGIGKHYRSSKKMKRIRKIKKIKITSAILRNMSSVLPYQNISRGRTHSETHQNNRIWSMQLENIIHL